MDDSLKSPPPVTLRDILRILRRRALLALLTLVTVVAATLFFTSRMPTVFEAKARLLMDGPTSTAAPASIMDLFVGSGTSPLDTEIEKIKSRSFLTKVIETARLKGETTDTLKSRLQIAPGPGGQILDIMVRAEKAETAKMIANTVAEKYITLNEDEYLSKATLSERNLLKAQREAKQQKKEADAALNAFNARLGLSNPGLLFQDRVSQTLTVRNQLEEARRGLILQEQTLANLQEQLKRIPPEKQTGYALVKNSVIDDYQRQLTDLEVQKEKLLFDYAEDSDEVKAIDREMAKRRASIEEAKQNMFAKSSRSVSRNGDYDKVQSQIWDTLFGIQGTKNLIRVLTVRSERLNAEQKRLLKQQQEYENLVSKRNTANDLFQQTQAGLIKMNVTRVLNEPNLRFLEPAKLPETPISPKPLLNLAMAIVLGLGLGMGAALLAEYVASGRMTEETLDNLPLVGGVPLLGVVSLRLPEPVAEEGLPVPLSHSLSTVDTLREIGFTLSHRHPKDPVPVVLLAGTRSNDTTAALAAQLAATLVRDGLRVTLVDADRVNPRLNRVFGAPDAPGLADVLAKRKRVTDILHIGAGGNLRFLAAGAPDDETPMSEVALRSLFRDLADKKTDIVLVSGPSVWQAPIVAPLEKAATGMVLIAPDESRGIAPAESVARARRLLSNGYKPNVLGVIVGTDDTQTGVPEGRLVLSSGETTVEREEINR